MTRLDAIKELAAKVEAGECPSIDLCMTALGEWSSLVFASGDGSIDAAKALHEAALPGWTLDQFGQRAGGWIAVLGCRDGNTPQPAPQAMVRDNPARAWLLAILRALIAQEEAP